MLPHRLLLVDPPAGLASVLARRLAWQPDFDVLLAAAAPSVEPMPGVSSVVVGAERGALRRVVLDFAPETVVLLAPEHDAARCEADPAACHAAFPDAVRRLARVCLGTGARLVVHSSDLVFDGHPGGCFAETARPAPSTVAGRHHLAAENAARGAGFHRWAIVRTGPVFGLDTPEDPLRRATSGSFTAFEAEHDALARPYTTADEAARGFERLVRARAHGLFHLAGDCALTPTAFANAARHAEGLPPLREPAPRTASGLLTLRARTELGWHPDGHGEPWPVRR
ncbi:MAG: sugar nucleotide-binding protein [Rhodothermales bacterium]|nr:sugar nucleotide-binding protein [Rhodothermales bacterium]